MKNKEHLKKLVQELGSNQTLSQSATLGELVNGLVHDLNNSLAIIWGFSEKIQNNPDSMSESIDKIISHTQKMANLLQNIRLYYKATPNEQASTTTLKDFVEKSLSICQPKLKSLNIYIEHGEIPNINFVCRVSNEIQAFVTKFYLYALNQYLADQNEIEISFGNDKDKLTIQANKDFKFTISLNEKEKKVA